MTPENIAKFLAKAKELGIPHAPKSFYQNASYTISFGNPSSSSAANEAQAKEDSAQSPSETQPEPQPPDTTGRRTHRLDG